MQEVQKSAEAEKVTALKPTKSPRCRIHPFAKFDFDYVKCAERLRAAGLTMDEIAWIFGLANRRELNRWKIKDPAFAEACKEGREIVKRRLVAAGLRAAWGYEYEDYNEKWTPDKETGKLELKEKSVFKKHAMPDAQLLMFMLTNIDPEQWKMRHKVVVDNQLKVNIKIDGKLDGKRIVALANRLFPKDTEVAGRKHIVATEVGRGVSEMPGAP